MADNERRAEIARLNDELRYTGKGGEMFMTSGIAALSLAEKLPILTEVRYFADFTPDNDPHGEHDCAVLCVRGRKIVWKIDYHARGSTGRSDPDPADPDTTLRVMIIMLAEEY